jgi:hypothetical protein
MMGNSAQILHELNTDPKWKDTVCAYVSCTDEPRWAAECMSLFEVGDGITMEKVCCVYVCVLVFDAFLCALWF